MQADEIVHRQIDSAQRRMDELHRRTLGAPPEAQPFVDEALHELQTTIEELQVSEEELRQQNETLAESREELEAERHRYRDLFHFAPDAYFVTDLDGVVREANHAAAALLHVRESTLRGKPLAVFVEAEQRRDFRTRLARLAAEERVDHWELRLQARGGEPVEVSCTVALLPGRNGVPGGLRWLVRDVTDQRRAEEAARRLETEHAARERSEAILESIADGFLAIDAEWRLTYLNRAAEFLLHCDRAEVLGQPVGVIFAEEAHPTLYRELRRAAREHDVAELEEFHARLASWLEFRVFPSPEGFTLHVRDVTEQKVIQAELRASEERLRVALQAAGMAHWDWDLRSGTVLWNPEHNRMVGLPPDQARGSVPEFVERVHPADRSTVSGALAHAARTGEDYRTDFRILDPRGEERWLAAYGRVLTGEDGRPARMVGVIRDATGERRRDDADRFLGRVSDVLASSLDYGSTLQSVATLCAGALADFCLVQVEEEGRIEALGVAHADARRAEILRGLVRRFPAAPGGADPAAQVLRTGEPQVLGGGPEPLPARVGSSPEHQEMLRDLDLASMLVVPLQARGRTLGVLTMGRTGAAPAYGEADLATAQEVARRAALAVDNARLYAEAREAARARDEVLAVVSHDLRNPLHAVLLAATVLQEFTDPEGWTERDRKQVEVIRRSAEQMSTLIQDLVEVISLESSAPALQRIRLDPELLVQGVAELFQALAAEKEVRLVVETAPRLPAVEADRGRLLQVFSNLVGNALKYTPAGGTVTVRAAPSEGAVRFSVADTGPGIPAEHLTRVFDRFWRARQGERGGLGLGLAIARGIVEAHGGRIGVESVPGEGAEFHFTVPALPF
ncbi:MAG TPA: PAS domain S-box protein [Longimicrobiaceae bacterium]|nr:PAS domain S-box protein [Longimicrobiaceae bacterium]